ncbi:histidine kinase [Clostridium cavendishii]|nr:histidine kinase [Clostridium cavendishii]
MDLAIDTIKEEQEHFIFSTLNTLNYFCRKDVMVSRSLVLALSNYLRLVFDKSDSVRGDELLKALKSYAYVQSIRLDKNIEFKYNDTLENYRLKKNPIQNIVESLLSFIRKNGIEKSLIDLDCLENKNNLEIYIKVIVPKNYKEEIENSNIFNRYIITNEENLVYKIDMRKCSVEE